jgi:choline dehydrogenase-like flavoprotein
VKKAIVVGSGAGGATAAKELQGDFDVQVLEAGREFRPLSLSLAAPERLKRLGLLFDERLIRLLFPAMKVQRSRQGMALVRGIGTGGTTTIATGNAMRLDQGLRSLGIDLDDEFAQLGREVPVSTAHRSRWNGTTCQLFTVFEAAGLAPRPLPKLRRRETCVNCGRCVLGCPTGAKWDSREFLEAAMSRGAQLVTGCRVERIVVEKGRAVGVTAWTGTGRRFYPADVVVLAAGGLGSPVILGHSGIRCLPRLFVDPVLCVAAPWPGGGQDREIPMPFVSEIGPCILSPYLDLLSYFFNRDWPPGPGNIISLMIKLGDEPGGDATGRRVDKGLTSRDKEALKAAVDACLDVLGRLGIAKREVFFGTLNAGHPGGMLPLEAVDARTLHPGALPEDLYLADATLLPEALGKPPILTVMALAKKVAKAIRAKLA